jgi:hypothetical protein
MSQWWPAAEPMLARFFDPRTAARLIEDLLAASRDTRLYQLTDYHWLVVYRCLEAFCDLHNDEAATDPTGRADVGPYSIGSIDFGAIVDRFFWDTDFLIGPELLELSADQRRRQLGFSDEAFSIAAASSRIPASSKSGRWQIRTGAAKTTSPPLTALSAPTRQTKGARTTKTWSSDHSRPARSRGVGGVAWGHVGASFSGDAW